MWASVSRFFKDKGRRILIRYLDLNQTYEMRRTHFKFGFEKEPYATS